MPNGNDDDHASRASLADAWESVDVRAAGDFWCTVEDRRSGLLPHRDAPLFFTALGRLLVGGDDPANRAALLRVLGRAYRHFDLLPHATTIGDALIATVARHARPLWTPQLTIAAERALYRATRAIRRAVAQADDGPAWWHVEVIGHDRPSPDIAILTVRQWRRLPFQAGQAVPVCTPRLPGHWRWLSPANAPRADGTVELHVRAVPAGTVSHRLVHQVRPGELLWLGPPVDIGLSSTSRARTICCSSPVAPAWRRCAPWSSRSPPHRMVGT
ncbi:FAD-binding oxidoreductase [Micromonospora sp. CPCC 205558]|uniref:FAD-binding oxidoreductase n=1 Tax=Micromonospora sp. CPCC 205558 TaxID=3122403 RepID=UPI002FEF6BDA